MNALAASRWSMSFVGTLRPDQEAAVAAMLRHDNGILCAPTAFGKTVTAAALIARRGVNTLVLVQRTELLKQWQERLRVFLGVEKGVIGTIGGGKAKPTGKIDIAVMQSLSRQGETNEIVENYGQVIADECHHLSAFSFEAILKQARARYVLGLTATPIRRDGRQPIIFMQCGPTRHTAVKPAGAPQTLEVIPRYLMARIDLAADAAIQNVFRHVASDSGRTAAIADEIAGAFEQGHKVLVLTERLKHLDAIAEALAVRVQTLFTLHGRMSKKQRAAMVSDLDALPADMPRVLLSTGKLVGEGFDHPPLDMLVLAMPISWKGTLQQYAGRLHREHANKTRVRIVDFVDAGHPALLRMWHRRQRGYQAVGYRIPFAQSAIIWTSTWHRRTRRVRGIEGAAARAYFGGYAAALPPAARCSRPIRTYRSVCCMLKWRKNRAPTVGHETTAVSVDRRRLAIVRAPQLCDIALALRVPRPPTLFRISTISACNSATCFSSDAVNCSKPSTMPSRATSWVDLMARWASLKDCLART